jgi:hypothetical protein
VLLHGSDLLHDRPQETNKLTGHGDDRDLGPLAIGQMVEALM